MKLYCPACNREILSADTNLVDKIAKCSGCNNIFSYADKLSFSGQDLQDRAAVGKPRSFKIERTSSGLQIVRTWFTPTVIFLTFFCLFWNGFMMFWFSMALSKKAYMMALFGSLHGAVGLGMLYAVLAGYFNKTYILITGNCLVVKHRPFPWAGEKNIPRQDLKQLYSKESAIKGENGYSHRYSVQVISKKGQVIELVSGLNSSEEALFIEQEVEKYLKIEDEPVRGEIQR